jgi:uncharacterized membrane protein YagU involved in acid resistance
VDLFFRGFFSGVGGGLIQILWGFITKDLLHFSTRNYLDWSAVILFGNLSTTWYESLLAFSGHLVWTGFLGIIFGYLLPLLSPRGYLFKGIVYSFMISYFLDGLAVIFRIPYFTMVPFSTALTNAIGSILWGICTAYFLHRLNRFQRKELD